MISVIRLRGSIHRWEMIDEAGVSIGDYNKLKSYMLFKNADIVKYDKDHEEWKYLYPTEEIKKEEVGPIQTELPNSEQ